MPLEIGRGGSGRRSSVPTAEQDRCPTPRPPPALLLLCGYLGAKTGDCCAPQVPLRAPQDTPQSPLSLLKSSPPFPLKAPHQNPPHRPLETLRDLPHPPQNPPRATEVPSDPSQSHRCPLSPLPGSPRRPRPAPLHHILFLTQTNAIGRRTLPAPPGAPLYPPHPLSSPNHSSPSPPRLLLPPPSPPPFGVLHWTV